MHYVLFDKLLSTLWHNSLKTISVFCDFWKQTICECNNFQQVSLDENIPVWLKSILCTGYVEFGDKTHSKAS